MDSSLISAYIAAVAVDMDTFNIFVGLITEYHSGFFILFFVIVHASQPKINDGNVDAL